MKVYYFKHQVITGRSGPCAQDLCGRFWAKRWTELSFVYGSEPALPGLLSTAAFVGLEQGGTWGPRPMKFQIFTVWLFEFGHMGNP